MKHLRIALTTMCLSIGIWASPTSAFEESPGGFRGGGGGGFRAGGFSSGGGFKAGGVAGGYHYQPRGGGYYKSGSVVGPSGGYNRTTKGGYSTLPGGGSYKSTTTRGATTLPSGIYTGGSNKGAYTGPRGGKVIYGHKGGSVTTPGGKTIQGGHGKSIVVTPNGGIHIQGGKAGSVSGPRGTVSGASRKGATVGPGGRVTVGGKTGVTVNGRFPSDHGLARYSSSYIKSGPYGTRYVSRTAMTTRAGYVRTGFRHYNVFHPAWYGAHPGVWRPLRWTVANPWAVCTWATLAAWYNRPAAPTYYDYGGNVVYQDSQVFVDGQTVATPQEYSTQAVALADQGAKTEPPKEETWQPLGVFAMVQGEEKTSNNIFQLAVSQKGVIRGNYYDALTDSTVEVKGSVDLKTLRAAWKIGDKKYPIYEVGLANLTKDETSMLVHFSADQTQQWMLVRLEEPKDKTK